MAGRPKTYSRPDVLAKAMVLFWKKGYEGVHLAELVEVIGLNRHSLYQEFGGKEGLFREALASYLATAERHYQSVLGASPLGLQNVRRYFRSIRYGNDYHGCFMISTLGQVHVVDHESFSMALQTARMAEQLFKRNIAAAVKSRELPEGTDVGGLSRTLAVLDQGLAIYGLVNPSRTASTSIVAQVDRLLGTDAPA